jgi:hypothetical protein
VCNGRQSKGRGARREKGASGKPDLILITLLLHGNDAVHLRIADTGALLLQRFSKILYPLSHLIVAAPESLGLVGHVSRISAGSLGANGKRLICLAIGVRAVGVAVNVKILPRTSA